MSKSNRNSPKRSTASESTCTRFEWDGMFPDDAACLEWLLDRRYPDGVFCPKCQRVTKHHRDTNRPSFQCQFCGHRIHPMRGTIFENSATSLKLWFDAIYLMASTRCGISAKQLERETGVTYKTAWRIFNRVRSVLVQGNDPFDGTVEADEAFFGGQGKWKHESKKPAKRHPRDNGPRGGHDRPAVFGIAQRGSDGKPGKVAAVVVPASGADDLLPHVLTKVLPESTVYTDEWKSYDALGGLGYVHERVSHKQKVYVSGDVHTNTIEGFWATVKRGIGGTYHAVGTAHLQSYLDEYAFRYNNREATSPLGMAGAFLDRVISQAEAS